MTEICVQVYADLGSIKNALLEDGYKFVEHYDNADSYFTTFHKDELSNVEYKRLLDNSLIVRHITGEDCDIKNIVHKKKFLDENGNVIKENKTKLKIDDINKAKSLFSNLGLYCWCDYINENYVFSKGEISFIVQYVEGLGTFIEIEEFKSIEEKPDKEKFKILKDLVCSLNFPIGKDFSCKKPYMFLNSTLLNSKNS